MRQPHDPCFCSIDVVLALHHMDCNAFVRASLLYVLVHVHYHESLRLTCVYLIAVATCGLVYHTFLPLFWQL